MRKRHLSLVVSDCEKEAKKTFMSEPFKNAKDYIDCLFLSKNEKIYILKDILIKIYRDYEITTGNTDLPYFIKAEIKISQIIQDKKIDYYYKKLKKFRNLKL